MMKPAKLCARRNWPRQHVSANPLPQFFLLSDAQRLPDPGPLLARLPRGACVILRHKNSQMLADLARHIVPQAHFMGLKVIVAGDVRLALRTGADGVHLSERQTRRGRPRALTDKPGFLLTSAAHSRLALWHAQQAGADLVLLSPVFTTKSHPGTRGLGPLRFAVLAQLSAVPVIALGGVTHLNMMQLAIGPAYGLAAIGAWQD